ncbi:hypothetical protein [Pseudomonas sp. URIL14HWK12:I6]|uniref:AbiJ-related protein n=1 Tax=Pseudomonas sp. URIL14HWK12:I6 TaxID=1283293 RepID=UPI0004810600|nr:hypothetical protein [Pseudomonas sp. URIL14HWK12:I6]
MAYAKNISLEEIRDAIAASLHNVKAYDLPAVCAKLGLEPGSEEEAYRSKRTYVRSRLRDHSFNDLIALAKNVMDEIGDADLQDFVSELMTPEDYRISDITRRAILGALDSINPLFGEIPPLDGLAILRPNWGMSGPEGHFLNTLHRDVEQHFVRNNDYTNSTVLKHCGAMTCSQQRFIDLIAYTLSPECRTDLEQKILVPMLTDLLAADGFTLMVVKEISRRAIYGISRLSSGVQGTAKNLIFASINSKPDLYLTDAINNEVAIRNQHDALIYDRSLSNNGLLWSELVGWWAHRENDDLEIAQRGLYKRLRDSVRQARSPGEEVIFDSYYRELAPLFKQRLPALIPQVYLHYDPKTSRQRGTDKVLLRERMDFLLLLEHGVRVVIEIDGQHHYAIDGKPAPARYAAMVAEDRRLRLMGYEVYRFGGGEFNDTVQRGGSVEIGDQSRALAVRFFKALFAQHGVTEENG